MFELIVASEHISNLSEFSISLANFVLLKNHQEQRCPWPPSVSIPDVRGFLLFFLSYSSCQIVHFIILRRDNTLRNVYSAQSKEFSCVNFGLTFVFQRLIAFRPIHIPWKVSKLLMPTMRKSLGPMNTIRPGADCTLKKDCFDKPGIKLTAHWKGMPRHKPEETQNDSSQAQVQDGLSIFFSWLGSWLMQGLGCQTAKGLEEQAWFQRALYERKENLDSVRGEEVGGLTVCVRDFIIPRLLTIRTS
eukprot:XP_006498574.1 PREDICTED: uncharacterized protein Gm13486 isoform X2 [Mus musculus]